jgi:hypothetical protein
MCENSNSFSIISWKKFMEVDYNILVQNHVNYNMLFKKITSCGGGVMVKDLTAQCGGEVFKSHTCTLGYLGHLGDLIR